MPQFEQILTPHPAHAPSAIKSVHARVDARDENWLLLRWRIEGAARLVVPPLAGRGRVDGLWQTTCFEMFIKPAAGSAYQEWNFSPSQAWAAYSFDDFRAGMTALTVARAPVVAWRGAASALRLMDVAVPRASLLPLPWCYSLTAVLEEEGGRMSYWAFAHPLGKADFHNPACFTGRLAAPPAP